jgi:hypothetical protein
MEKRTTLLTSWYRTCLVALILVLHATAHATDGTRFEGEHYRGNGDTAYLRLLETARRMFAPDPEFQSLPMLYTDAWNGFTEGPTWKAWWIQNSYGTSYCALPFLDEPLITFLERSNDLWFSQMGDGKRAGANGYVAPDGCLCDAAGPGFIYYRQGDGRPEIHDWAVEFTAAGLMIEAESLLIAHDPVNAGVRLPQLERIAEFLESRHDPKNDLMRAGPGANLLAPSYAGYRKPDGTYAMAYLAGLSVTTCAALDRLIEVEKLAGRSQKAALYTHRRSAIRHGLERLTTPEGYFIRSLDPDGARHGVFGAKLHGYFETPPNHDAIAFRIVEDSQAKRIYEWIKAIPELRPHALILSNYPSYDDMYEEPTGIWQYGTWVNGGNWSTCEARMILAYYRLGDFDAARRSMEAMLRFAGQFRMDNPLSGEGSEVYQPAQPINLTYDAFGPSAALLRGLFEYLYRADSLTLVPHIPPGITEIEQLDPVRFGSKRLTLTVAGQGPITEVRVNGTSLPHHDATSVTLPYAALPDIAVIEILRGGAPQRIPEGAALSDPEWRMLRATDLPAELQDLAPRVTRLQRFYAELVKVDLFDTYEAAHTRLALQAIDAAVVRHRKLTAGTIAPLSEPLSEAAADQSYHDTAIRLFDGLEAALTGARVSTSPDRSKILACWRRSAP